jgi:DNA-binding SARP family transcriptional activator
MSFSILGSLDVKHPGGRIHITAPKQKIVLSALLLEADNEVSSESLIDHVWDGRPPTAAQTTLQSYVYRLRQLLSPLPQVNLRNSTSGYTIELGSCVLDLRLFHDRMAEAGAAARHGDKTGSVTALRNGLSIWRGSALAGVPGELLRREAALLENERIAAYEELASLELELGNHRRMIPDLHKIVTEYPFHEVFTAQLMLALYRSGRQAEALQDYEIIRRKLRDDLGIEPGAELRHLQMAILERAPAMEVTLVPCTQ